jgi:hypothetical protein
LLISLQAGFRCSLLACSLIQVLCHRSPVWL